jgi:hypothetical protein
MSWVSDDSAALQPPSARISITVTRPIPRHKSDSGWESLSRGGESQEESLRKSRGKGDSVTRSISWRRCRELPRKPRRTAARRRRLPGESPAMAAALGLRPLRGTPPPRKPLPPQLATPPGARSHGNRVAAILPTTCLKLKSRRRCSSLNLALSRSAGKASAPSPTAATSRRSAAPSTVRLA